VPSPELSEGIDETAKITPAQRSTGSHREATTAIFAGETGER
jgi:hypothetical protein